MKLSIDEKTVILAALEQLERNHLKTAYNCDHCTQPDDAVERRGRAARQQAKMVKGLYSKLHDEWTVEQHVAYTRTERVFR